MLNVKATSLHTAHPRLTTVNIMVFVLPVYLKMHIDVHNFSTAFELSSRLLQIERSVSTHGKGHRRAWKHVLFLDPMVSIWERYAGY